MAKAANEDSNQIFISRLPPLPVPLKPTEPTFDIPKTLETLPEAPIVISLFEEIQLSVTEKISLFASIAKATPLTLKIIYGIVTMDWAMIMRIVAVSATGFIASKTGIVPETDIAGTPLVQWVEMGLAVVVGALLPQLRYLSPQWARDLLKWNKDPKT